MDEKLTIPTELKHKPVISVEDYANIDSHHFPATDVRALSLGLAQWNDRGKVDISAKVWRHSGERWSRQSEELPIHRVIDLSIVIAKALEYFREAYRYPALYDGEKPEIARVGLEGDAFTMKVCTDNKLIDEDIKLFYDVLSKQDEQLSEHLALLARTLNELGYGNTKR